MSSWQSQEPAVRKKSSYQVSDAALQSEMGAQGRGLFQAMGFVGWVWYVVPTSSWTLPCAGAFQHGNTSAGSRVGSNLNISEPLRSGYYKSKPKQTKPPKQTNNISEYHCSDFSILHWKNPQQIHQPLSVFSPFQKSVGAAPPLELKEVFSWNVHRKAPGFWLRKSLLKPGASTGIPVRPVESQWVKSCQEQWVWLLPLCFSSHAVPEDEKPGSSFLFREGLNLGWEQT